MSTQDLAATARALAAPGKGILAADESSGTIEKRFDSIHVESTEENRRAYRELLFTTDGMGEFISGVILYDETLRQRSVDGTPFAEVLAAQGIIPGIKVDNGAKPLAGFVGEKITEGLDGLRDRLASTTNSAPGSPSGGRSSPLATGSRRGAVSTPTPRRSPASPPCHRRSGSSRSSSPRC